MTPEDFITAVEEMEGLTDLMVEHLVAIAPKLTDEQRADTIEKLRIADGEIITALGDQETLIKQEEQEMHAIERDVTRQEESGEHAEDEREAEDLLNNM